MDDVDLTTEKRRVRAERLAWRASLPAALLASTAEAFGERILAEASGRRASVVSLYASVGAEPGTRVALDRLHGAGIRVLLPVLIVPGLDLDWADYEPGRLQEARRGLEEPDGERLGRDAIALADVVFCPGLAATPDGRRLGQGGGCYDKALPRARPDALRLLVLYDEDVLEDLPAGPRDQRVDALLTPTQTKHVRARAG